VLKLAFPYQKELNNAWQTAVFSEKYKFYNFTNYWDYEIKLDANSWNVIQMVSVDTKGSVLGYFSASCDRSANKVSSAAAMNFGEPNFIFSRDFYIFLASLFEKYGFHKIEWCVVIGNPAERIYDRLIDKYGGHVVGVQHESTRLSDGVLCDVKEYELFKRDYERRGIKQGRK
jgi:hypothetical protein